MRREDWPERLADFIAASQGRRFVWGASDCCLFSADGVLAITGVNYGAEFRGRYKTARGAMALLKKHGNDGLLSMMNDVAKRNGWEKCNTPMARRGDVALIGQDFVHQHGGLYFGGALGIVIGGGVALMSDSGLITVPLSLSNCVWRVD